MMKKRAKIRISGARARRLYRRFIAFLGLTALYSLTFSAADAFSIDWLFGILLLIGAAIGLCIGFFKMRDKRKAERRMQIITEAEELHPEMSPEERCEVSLRLRHKEMRLESLLYLCFAAASFGWCCLLHAFDTGLFGLAVLIAACGVPLVISLGLFLASFANGDPTEYMERLSDVKTRDLLERLKRPDRRSERNLAEVITISDADFPETGRDGGAYVREALSGYHFVSWLAFGFFVVFPLVLCIFVFVMQFVPFLLFFGMIAAFSISIWFYLEYMTDGMVVSPFRLLYWLIRSRTGACGVSKDAVVAFSRYEDKQGVMEVCFDRAGTYWVKWRDTYNGFRQLLLSAESEVALVTVGKRFLTVILKEKETVSDRGLFGTEAERATRQADGGSASSEKNAEIKLLSSYEITKEAERRLKQMDPAVRRETEREIREYLDLSHLYVSKTLANDHMTRGQEAEYWRAQNFHRSRLIPNSELGSIESHVMNKLHASREEISRMKKNPYAKSTFLTLIIAAAVGIGGIVGTALIEKYTGAELGFLYIIFGIVTSSLALAFGNRLINMLRFRKLQRAYRNPDYQENLIQSEVYKKIYEQVQSEYDRSHN